MARKPTKPGTGKIYRAYWFSGADPAIAEVKEFVGARTLSSIERDGGPATSTMANWFKGKTRGHKMRHSKRLVVPLA